MTHNAGDRARPIPAPRTLDELSDDELAQRIADAECIIGICQRNLSKLNFEKFVRGNAA